MKRRHDHTMSNRSQSTAPNVTIKSKTILQIRARKSDQCSMLVDMILLQQEQQLNLVIQARRKKLDRTDRHEQCQLPTDGGDGRNIHIWIFHVWVFTPDISVLYTCLKLIHHNNAITRIISFTYFQSHPLVIPLTAFQSFISVQPPTVFQPHCHLITFCNHPLVMTNHTTACCSPSPSGRSAILICSPSPRLALWCHSAL